MKPGDVDELCAEGQRYLAEMRYLEAEAALVAAEGLALKAEGWDTLARLYMPLQEARRQRRQRCGEGTIRLDLLAEGPTREPEARSILKQYQQGQLLVAGWGSIARAVEVRREVARRGLYVEVFLGAVYPLSAGGRLLVICPSEHDTLPRVEPAELEMLRRNLPDGATVLELAKLPAGDRPGDTRTFAETMLLWEQLHAPFLARARATADRVEKIHAYRRAIEVDYACEFAHQELSETAKDLARG